MASLDEFDDVRRDPDPIRRGRRATELLTIYQQRAAELARLRRAAIEDAHRDRGMSYTQIAAAMGITKGRISQIRGTAPPRSGRSSAPARSASACRCGTASPTGSAR